jgi:arginase family enzyme
MALVKTGPLRQVATSISLVVMDSQFHTQTQLPHLAGLAVHLIGAVVAQALRAVRITVVLMAPAAAATTQMAEAAAQALVAL